MQATATATATPTDKTATTARADRRAARTDKAARAAAESAATDAAVATAQPASEGDPATAGEGAEPTVAQLIGDSLAPIIERRDELESTIDARRAEVEAELAPKVTQLAELNQFIRAIERKQGHVATGGPRAPRGQNRDKILAVIARDARTTREISDATGIGRGSADRTLKQLEEAGEASKTADGWIAVAAAA